MSDKKLGQLIVSKHSIFEEIHSEIDRLVKAEVEISPEVEKQYIERFGKQLPHNAAEARRTTFAPLGASPEVPAVNKDMRNDGDQDRGLRKYAPEAENVGAA